MAAIVAMIARLIEHGAAYAAEGHVLFDTTSYADYGKLSGRLLDEMIAGARVDVAPYKRNPADFVLWKPSKASEPQWESPWGAGRPGWHIECSAMIEQTLGLPIDIHGGGIDLVFPHHENERAQGVCATDDHTYSRFWMHNGFLNFGEEKMSKSLGNVALAHDLLAAYPGEAIRWALLVGHYRAPLEWNSDLLDQARRSLDRLYGALGRAEDVVAYASHPAEAFLTALEDDLNTAQAMSELFRLASKLETGGPEEKARAKGELLASANLLGFLTAEPETWFKGGVDEDLKSRIDGLIAARDEARRAKDWPQADRIRAELTALNVEVMDGPAGATWRLKEQV
jgi:cysteinyl-tRNA synthetase